MELETVSPKQPPFQPPMQAVPPATQQLETHANAGMVRVPETLGFEPAPVDCHFCKKVIVTEIKKTPSQMTVMAQYFCGFLFSGFCCCLLTYPIPARKEWYFDTHHKCSDCGNEITFVGYQQKQITPRFVASRYGS